jgi:hypothetical protein
MLERKLNIGQRISLEAVEIYSHLSTSLRDKSINT